MKRNRLIGVILCFIGFSAYLIFSPAGCGRKTIKNVGSSGSTIVCFGDSLTFGYGVPGGDDYPAALSKMLNMPVINAGIDGDSSGEALKRIQSDVLDRNPMLVIIEFGGNDFLRKVPLENTIANISQMADMVQEKGAMAAIVDISSGIFMATYRKALRALAENKQAIFVPSVLSGIITNPEMKSDFLHPNAEGYRLIAQRVHKEVAGYLRRNSPPAVQADKN